MGSHKSHSFIAPSTTAESISIDLEPESDIDNNSSRPESIVKHTQTYKRHVNLGDTCNEKIEMDNRSDENERASKDTELPRELDPSVRSGLDPNTPPPWFRDYMESVSACVIEEYFINNHNNILFK